MNKIISVPQTRQASTIEALTDPSITTEEKIRVATRLEAMLEEEFQYSSIRPQLAAWMYSNSQMETDLNQASRLNKAGKTMRLSFIYTAVKSILTDVEDTQYEKIKTSEEKIEFLKLQALQIPFERVTSHNCFGIIIYAAFLEKIITIQGGNKLFSEILGTRFKGGGFIFERGTKEITKCRVIENGLLQNIDETTLDQLDSLCLDEGSIVIFSSTQAGIYDGITSPEHFFAHVGCVGKNRDILDFWGGTRLNRRSIQEAALQVIREHKKIHITVVNPPWKSYGA